MSQSRLTCAGGGVAFTQFLRQFGHLAAYWFVAAQQSIFRDGVILGSSERPVIILLREREEGEGCTKEKAVKCCVSSSNWSMKTRPRNRAKLSGRVALDKNSL